MTPLEAALTVLRLGLYLLAAFAVVLLATLRPLRDRRAGSTWMQAGHLAAAALLVMLSVLSAIRLHGAARPVWLDTAITVLLLTLTAVAWVAVQKMSRR